jgi:hypothetical protein
VSTLTRAQKIPAASALHSRPPLERMLRIHQALQGGGFPNASKLASEIEVATKTIHRDIEFMRDRLNLPIEFDKTSAVHSAFASANVTLPCQAKKMSSRRAVRPPRNRLQPFPTMNCCA